MASDEEYAKRYAAEQDAKYAARYAAENPSGIESIAGGLRDLAAGGLRGAVSIGSTILAPFQAAWEGTGQSGAQQQRGKIINDVDNGLKYLGADPDSGLYKTGKFGAEVAGTLGAGDAVSNILRGAVPQASKIATAIETFGGSAGPGGGLIRNALTRLGGAGVSGGVQSGMIDPENAASGAGIGMAIPVVGQGLKYGAKAIGWLDDLARGQSGTVQAGRLARDAAGTNRAAIEQANATAAPNLTAGQAAHGIDQDTYQALAEFAKRNDMDSYYRVLSDANEATRAAALKAVTPNLAAAEAARNAASTTNYGAANTAQFGADSALASIFKNPYTKQAHAAAKDLIESNGLDFKTNPTGYLQAVKLGFDKMLSRTGDTALSGAEKAAVYKTRNQMLSWLETKNPLFKTARAEHARLSEPINQAKVLNEMSSVLQRGGGGERVQPFLDVMGRGESALLKRADQSARFGGIDDILNPQQLGARDDVLNQLIRDRDIATQAKEGAGGLMRLMQQDTGLPRLPSYLSVISSSTNKALSALEEKISKQTLDALVQGMKSGANANQLMATVPASERNAALMWVAKGGPNKYMGATVAGAQ